jgi:hypothetical protein
MKLPALDKTLQLKYVSKWKAKNELFLNNMFGLEDGPQFLFLTLSRMASCASSAWMQEIQPCALDEGDHRSPRSPPVSTVVNTRDCQKFR